MAARETYPGFILFPSRKKLKLHPILSSNRCWLQYMYMVSRWMLLHKTLVLQNFFQFFSWTWLELIFFHGNISSASYTDVCGCIRHVLTALHYNDVVMGAMASQITSPTIIYSTIYSGADQTKHQSSASLAFVRGIHRWPVNSPHKWPVTRKMFPFDDVIIVLRCFG